MRRARHFDPTVPQDVLDLTPGMEPDEGRDNDCIPCEVIACGRGLFSVHIDGEVYWEGLTAAEVDGAIADHREETGQVLSVGHDDRDVYHDALMRYRGALLQTSKSRIERLRAQTDRILGRQP